MENLDRNLQVISKIIKRIEKPINYVLSGSTSLAFQGVEVEPHDIDIFTDKDGVNYLYSILSDYAIEKLGIKDTPIATSYYSKYVIDNVQVEVIGDFITKKEDGSCNETIMGFDDIIYKKYGEVKIPLWSLEKELQGYKNLHRAEKVKKIEDALTKIHF